MSGRRAWCCGVEGCEYLEAWRGELQAPHCPAHHTVMMLLVLVPQGLTITDEALP